MSVEVRVTSVLQRVVGGKSVQGEGKTVGEVLAAVNSQYPGFREQITQEDGSLHRFVNIYINDEDIRFMQQLETPVSEGDVVSILPALAGGAFPVSDAAFALHRSGAARPHPKNKRLGTPQTPAEGLRPSALPASPEVTFRTHLEQNATSHEGSESFETAVGAADALSVLPTLAEDAVDIGLQAEMKGAKPPCGGVGVSVTTSLLSIKGADREVCAAAGLVHGRAPVPFQLDEAKKMGVGAQRPAGVWGVPTNPVFLRRSVAGRQESVAAIEPQSVGRALVTNQRDVASKLGAGAQRPARGVGVSPTFLSPLDEAEQTGRDAKRPLSFSRLGWL